MIPRPVQIQGNLYKDNITNQIATKEKAQAAFAASVTEQTNQRNRDVNAHEDAHASRAGSYGGGKVISFGSDQLGNPLALGGHVPIQMPPMVNAKMSLAQIDKAENHATTVAFAAIAPVGLGGEAGKLSSADKAVYAQATKAAGVAQAARSQKLSFEGKTASREGQTPDKNQESNAGIYTNSINAGEARNKGRKPLNILI